VGTSALALPVSRGRSAEVVSGAESGGVEGLAACPSPRDPALPVLRPRARMAGLLLVGRNSSGLFTAHAVFGEQPHAPGSLRRRRLQQERLVTGTVTIDGLGRELAPEPPLQRRLGTPRAALAANGHRVVPHLRPGNCRPRQQHKTTQSTISTGSFILHPRLALEPTARGAPELKIPVIAYFGCRSREGRALGDDFRTFASAWTVSQIPRFELLPI